jgi:hypothetical protein
MDGCVASALSHVRETAGREVTSQTMKTPEQRRRNIRTGLILLSIALVFFVGVIVRHWVYGS